MKIIKESKENLFPYIAYIPDNISTSPALIIQLHGAGERGDGGDELDLVTVHGFSKIVNDSNFKDCVLIMPQCPKNSFWAAKVESIKSFIDEMILKYYLQGKPLIYLSIYLFAYPHFFLEIFP